MVIYVNGSIYTVDNKYNSLFDINHPVIRQLYNRYLEKYNIPKHIGLTDAQRFQFEAAISEMIRRKKIVVEVSDEE